MPIVARRHNVGVAIAVQIANRHRLRRTSCGITDPAFERPIPIAEKNSDGSIALICNHQVKQTVVVNFSYCERSGQGSSGNARRYSKGSIAVAEQNVNCTLYRGWNRKIQAVDRLLRDLSCCPH